MILSVGITEKGSISMGAVWNSKILFDRDGTLLNLHRKLCPRSRSPQRRAENCGNWYR